MLPLRKLWMDDYKDIIKISRKKITITEELIGAYEIEEMLFDGIRQF